MSTQARENRLATTGHTAWSALRPVLPLWAACQAAIAIALTAGAAANGEPILHTWTIWDAGWFRRVAVLGYDGPGSEGAPAFYPLYPAAMHVLDWVPVLDAYAAGVVVSLLSSLAAFALLYRLAELLFDDAVAKRTVLYLAVFPTVVFTQLVYSESLFLVLATATFLAAERRRLIAAGALAGLALLTRPVGFALLPALALFALRGRRLRDGAAGIAVALGLFALYPALLVQQGRSPMAFVHAEEVWERYRSPLGPLGGVIDGTRAAWGGILQLTWGPDKPYWSTFHSNHQAILNITNLAALVLVLGLVALVASRLSSPYLAYVAVAVAMPLTAPSEPRPLQSMARFALALFPCFIALGSLQLKRSTHAALLAASGLLALCVIGWWTSRWFVA